MISLIPYRKGLTMDKTFPEIMSYVISGAADTSIHRKSPTSTLNQYSLKKLSGNVLKMLQRLITAPINDTILIPTAWKLNTPVGTRMINPKKKID